MKLQTNLRKGDNIIVNSGKFRGKTDIIENINKNFVFLSSLSIIKKFKLKNLKEGDPTEKKIFIPIRISNVSF
jgi:ribosomal protein L24